MILVIFIAVFILFLLMKKSHRNDAKDIQAMFPFLSIRDIQNDLKITKSKEITIDNIISGRLAASASTASIEPQNNEPKDKFFVKPQPTSKYLTEQKISKPQNQWKGTEQERTENLIQRKQFLIQKAREKFIQKN